MKMKMAEDKKNLDTHVPPWKCRLGHQRLCSPENTFAALGVLSELLKKQNIPRNAKKFMNPIPGQDPMNNTKVHCHCHCISPLPTHLLRNILHHCLPRLHLSTKWIVDNIKAKKLETKPTFRLWNAKECTDTKLDFENNDMGYMGGRGLFRR